MLFEIHITVQLGHIGKFEIMVKKKKKKKKKGQFK